MRRLNDTQGGDPPVTADLLERCRAGDQVAWAELVRVTYREVYTLCLRILKDPDDASEATQETYLKVWRGLPGFRGDAAFSTWLYRVATNAAISRHRSRGRRRKHESGFEQEHLELLPATGSTEATASARLDVRSVESAVAGLPDSYRVPLLLRDVYNNSIEEIAGVLGISTTAAKVRIHRARKKVKEAVYPDGEGGAGG
jgi:RNA polymerase sigma-70 factor, ECF subfamily